MKRKSLGRESEGEASGASAGSRGRLAAVVPTLGRSPWLGACLVALRQTAGADLQLAVVAPRGASLAGAQEHADVLVATDRPLGFAAAVNRGLGAVGAAWVAVVNDDALLEPDWAAALLAALDAVPGAAAAQGVNFSLDRPDVLDGWGLDWNRWWQAVQLGHGEPAATAPVGLPREVFGVAATAALYRRAALETVALAPGRYFDERLGSYYEDVDLAVRLRRAGWTALAVPAAGARHAGSATGGRRPFARWTRVYGNRHLVAARHLGRAWPAALPRLAARDLADLARALAGGELSRAAAIPAGWARAAALMPAFAHRGGRVG